MPTVTTTRLACACDRAIQRIERERATVLIAGSTALAIDPRLQELDRRRARVERLRDRARYAGRPEIAITDAELAHVHRDFPLTAV